MQIANEPSEFIVTCIQVIGGGPFRCATQNYPNFCTDEESQESLEL
jgi:hypothetical protein